jgi:hypothetical protein
MPIFVPLLAPDSPVSTLPEPRLNYPGTAHTLVRTWSG